MADAAPRASDATLLRKNMTGCMEVPENSVTPSPMTSVCSRRVVKVVVLRPPSSRTLHEVAGPPWLSTAKEKVLSGDVETSKIVLEVTLT